MDTEHYLRLAEVWANALDNQFHFGPFRFGIDVFLDLLPGGGDVLAVILSLYLLWIGIKLQLPTKKLARMILNISIDFFIGLLPIVGDVGYLFYKANLYNLQILKDHVSDNGLF